MSSINGMFDSANTMNNVAAGGNAANLVFSVYFLGGELAENAEANAATIFKENGKDYVVTATGLIRGRGTSAFYYTLNRAADARQTGALVIGGIDAAREFGFQALDNAGEVWSPLLSSNPAQGVANAENEMGAQMSENTYETIKGLQDILRNLMDEYQNQCCGE